ncbi:hypothetical protein ACFLY8_02295 [Halobacteriota archaeon]
MIDIDFFDRVREIKKELNIQKGVQNDTDSRRIAVYLTEDAFAYGLDVITEAPFFERRLYDLLKDTELRCDPIPEEERVSDKRIKGFNVLKLTFEPWSFPDMEFNSYRYDDIIKDILEILASEDQESEEVKDAKESDRSVPSGVASQWFY